jgi:transposase
VVLPNRAKKYFQFLGIKSKNDKIDANGLARMGAQQDLRPWEPFSPEFYNLRSLTRQHEGLSSLRTELISKIKNQKYMMIENETVTGQLTSMLQMTNNQIKETQKAINVLIENDADLKNRIDKITKIKGLGLLSVVTVIAETNGFILFENQRQLVKYSGYDIVENQSGKHVGKTKISKKGNAHIRRILHMPALNAVRWNEPAFKNLYDRVYGRTKIKMKGYVAVQRKLLVMIYTLWKKNTEYQPNFENDHSSHNEPKSLISGFKKAGGKAKKVVPAITAGTTLDGLPCNELPEALFLINQN